MTTEEHLRHEAEITTVRNGCMTSMLLCLDRQQRVVFILGGIFNIKSAIASRLLDISPENFRKQLSRAKADLFSFMDNKCGLINPDNPCRCAKKAKGFIKDGLIEKSNFQFKTGVVKEIRNIASENNNKLDKLMEGKYLSLFRRQPYNEKPITEELINSILFNKEIAQLFKLN